MISFTEYFIVLQFVTYLQVVQCIEFALVIAFVLVTQSFTCIGFNIIATKIILHDGYWTWVSISRESFTGILDIRTISVQSSFLLQWKERGVRRVYLQA